jgi:hypothetical protein
MSSGLERHASFHQEAGYTYASVAVPQQLHHALTFQAGPYTSHMTFVHSCGNLGLLLSGDVLDRCCDLRGIIEMGEPVLPWAILFQRPLDILHQVTEAFPFVIPCALIMHITEGPLNGIGPGAICWQPEQGKSWVVC